MKIFNKFKRKIHYLIERINLSESDYLTMKAQSQMYKSMMSTVKYSLCVDCEDIKDNGGNLITKFYKGQTITIDVDIIEMLAEGGITFDKNAVKLNVIGL